MARLTATEKALLRRAMEEETQTLAQGGQNTSTEYLSAFPRMMYRKTDERDEIVVSTDRNGIPRETSVVNSFGGMLCETMVVDDADQAEALSAEGWDLTPEAAHGIVSGLAAQTTAKDDEIAALRAELEAMKATQPRRGRPPNVSADPAPVE